jgi:hypothetical protein
MFISRKEGDTEPDGDDEDHEEASQLADCHQVSVSLIFFFCFTDIAAKIS